MAGQSSGNVRKVHASTGCDACSVCDRGNNNSMRALGVTAGRPPVKWW